MKGDITSDLSMTGEATNNQFGYSVSSAGDVNGDGFSDDCRCI
ncbi:MAG: integrin alpha [Ignavibacteria bacterium]